MAKKGLRGRQISLSMTLPKNFNMEEEVKYLTNIFYPLGFALAGKSVFRSMDGGERLFINFIHEGGVK